MNKLKGTKTERNLMEAFAGESQARNKYTYYASKARKDGYELPSSKRPLQTRKSTPSSGSNISTKARFPTL